MRPANAETCEREKFEAVVDEASATLVQLTQKNTPVFQARLRQLREKRNWTHEQFMKEAAPLVRDDQIVAYDENAERLLAKINNQGSTTSSDCAVLAELRASMGALVATQNAKWAYMFGKLEAELAK